MTHGYFELRTSPKGGITPDIMRHMHTRQHLGKVVIVTDQTRIIMSAARKQWLKLTRNMQAKRASTLSADQILKYTHTVTHMQHMQFTNKSPLEAPQADVYFMTAEMIEELPLRCFTVYLTVPLTGTQIHNTIHQLPADALIVDYQHDTHWERLGVRPRSELEDHVAHAWRQLEYFLTTYHINIEELSSLHAKSTESMEEALDILLGASHRFLQIAGDFQRALELARPIKLTKNTRTRYDAASLLAHRVQALSPGAFTQSFLEAYNEDDTFYMYDHGHDPLFGWSANLADVLTRHKRAGRSRLAAALQLYYSTPRKSPDW